MSSETQIAEYEIPPQPPILSCTSTSKRRVSVCCHALVTSSATLLTEETSERRNVGGRMEAPIRDQSSLPVIKCSGCGRDVEMSGLAEHQCASTPPVISLPPPRTDSSNSLRSMRSQRPPLPRIDPTVGFRPPAYHGELTPTSSGHNSLISPVSAGTGSRPPWPVVRKGSIPGPRPPPSPELANFDCAFPAFPLPARAATTKKRDRSTTKRSETKRSRSRDTQKGSRRPGVTREGSSTTGTMTGEASQPLKPSRPASPLSNGLNLDNPQDPAQAVPETHLSLQSSSLAVQSQERKQSLPSTGLQLLPLTFNTQTQVPSDRGVDPGLSSFDFGGAAINTSATESVEPTLNERPRADTEPAYKSKRPPPILSHPAILPLAKSPTAPEPSPSGSFGRSLGRLFSRRRSQSAAARRDVARQALSDEPESSDRSLAGQSILSPGSDRSYFTAEPSPLATSPLALPWALPDHEESLKTLEEEPSDTPEVALPVVVIEPAIERSTISGDILFSSFDVRESPQPSEVPGHTPISDGAELIEALRRVSIDSASSYGSIGFSEQTTFSEGTTSSRSTAPHMDAMPTELVPRPDSFLIPLVDVDVPAPLRPKMLELSPDSPTDPLFQQGRLSPIPPSAHSSQDSIDSLPSIHIERHESPELRPEPQTPRSDILKPQIPNKGVCRGCSLIILAGEKSVSSADGRLTGRYHKKCFACQACKSSFPTAEFYVHNDHPYCAHHYHELEDSLCATCGKGIEGLYMETTNVAGRGKEKHHPECLKCETCKIRLDHDYFELSGKVYCERDAFRLAMLPKSHDNAPSRPSPLIREYISSMDPNLVKGRNFPERRLTTLMNMI